MTTLLRAVSPIDGTVVDERHAAAPAAIDAALTAAVRAQRAWRRTPAVERAAVCRRMVDWCVARADVLGDELTRQMGRPIAHSPLEIRGGLAERTRHLADLVERGALDDVDVGEKAGFERCIRREPLGVVFVVAPWNYPWLTSANAVVAALLAGNAVVLKPAQQTPLVGERYAEAFRAAGLPDGVLQLLHLDHDQVAGIIADPRVDFVAFTGSVGGGHAVQRAAAGRFVGTGLELGGKDPAYVRADAALAPTVENLVDGAFFNAGQSCCAVERIYVHRDVYDEFVDRFVALTRGYRLGNPLDPQTTLGPLVRTAAADAVREQVRGAVAMGARALIDAAGFAADRAGTPYLAPQVLVDVDHRMAVMTDETFGPAVGIMSVAGDDEAVERMNDSRYGLTASVWTADVDAARRIGDRVETGTWYMNRCDHLDPALAWTGVKDSGRGVTLSRLGLEAFTRPKSFHLRLSI